MREQLVHLIPESVSKSGPHDGSKTRGMMENGDSGEIAGGVEEHLHNPAGLLIGNPQCGPASGLNPQLRRRSSGDFESSVG